MVLNLSSDSQNWRKSIGEGFQNVFQLKGGILNYLKKIKKKESMWKGECFVFDNRVSVKHNLAVGSYFICSG